MDHALVVVTEPGRTPLHIRLHRPLEIGRDCEGLLLTDALLSRRHLRLTATGGQVTVEDLGSTNGTLVNAVRIGAAQMLRVDDRVQTGSAVFEVH